jgi:hypothetical protein
MDKYIQPANAFAYQILLWQKDIQEKEDEKKEHDKDQLLLATALLKH